LYKNQQIKVPCKISSNIIQYKLNKWHRFSLI
ncbi:hypothetical protein T4B_2262, partial [Trichinella pseudospiralis]